MDWKSWGVALAGLDIQAAREVANSLEAESHLEEWALKEWVGISALPVSFFRGPANAPRS